MGIHVSSQTIHKRNIELRFWNGSLSEILAYHGFSLLAKTRINWAQQYYFICLNFIYRKF